MQIFLPEPSFSHSAMCLDKSRLGNQFWRECKTLYTGGWRYHPAALMLRDYPWAMCSYALACVNAAEVRNWYTPECRAKWFDYWYTELTKHERDRSLPPWLGTPAIHASHRGTLLWKDPEWYGQFGWREKPLPPDPDTGKFQYVWPE